MGCGQELPSSKATNDEAANHYFSTRFQDDFNPQCEAAKDTARQCRQKRNECWDKRLENETINSDHEFDVLTRQCFDDYLTCISRASKCGDVVEVKAGHTHTCARFKSGDVKCWGGIGSGELGYGHRRSIGQFETPASVGFVSLGGKVKQLAVSDFSCALLESGDVRCFGNNDSGQLGYGHTRDIGDDELPSSMPVVNVGGKVAQIEVGYDFACARLVSGQVKCWGNNTEGTLGYGHTRNIGDNEPLSSVGYVDLGGKASSIFLGSSHACAVLENGDLKCWGQNRVGVLGYGHDQSIGDDETPRLAGNVNLGEGLLQGSLGFAHSCAILASKNAKCWGRGFLLGYGGDITIGDDETPAAVGYLELGGPVKQLSINHSSCALLESGQVKCWGDNHYGQLGYGHKQFIGEDTSIKNLGPVDLGEKATQISLGVFHTCAVMASGNVKCWGSHGFGKLGLGNSDDIGDDETPASVGYVPLK